MSTAAASDPFGSTANPASYVPRPASERALEAVELALVQGLGPVAITGPAGLGKTMLLAVLGERLGDRYHVVRVPYPALSAAEICRWVLESLGEPSDAAGDDPEGALLDRAFRGSAAGREILLLVDDASSLPPRSARGLASLVAASGGAIRAVLAAVDDARLGAALGALGAGAREVQYDEPMTADETAAYVRARLASVGDATARAALFDGDALARIYGATGGIARRVHELGSVIWRSAEGTDVAERIERWVSDEQDGEAEPPAEAIEIDTGAEAPAEAIEIDTGAEAPAEAIEIDTEAEAPAEAIGIDTGAEAPAEAIEIDTEAEAPAEAIGIDTGAEAPAEAIEIDTEAEAPAEAIGIDTGAEAPAEAIEIDTGAEAPAEAIEIDTGAEAPAEAIEIDTEAEPLLEVGIDEPKKPEPSADLERSLEPAPEAEVAVERAVPPAEPVPRPARGAFVAVAALALLVVALPYALPEFERWVSRVLPEAPAPWQAARSRAPASEPLRPLREPETPSPTGMPETVSPDEAIAAEQAATLLEIEAGLAPPGPEPASEPAGGKLEEPFPDPAGGAELASPGPAITPLGATVIAPLDATESVSGEPVEALPTVTPVVVPPPVPADAPAPPRAPQPSEPEPVEPQISEAAPVVPQPAEPVAEPPPAEPVAVSPPAEPVAEPPPAEPVAEPPPAEPVAEPPPAEPVAEPPPAEPVAVSPPAPEPAPPPAPRVRRRPAGIPVRIEANPRATIHVDGGRIGRTPLPALELSRGLHVIRADFPDGRAVVRAVEVSARTRRIYFEASPDRETEESSEPEATPRGGETEVTPGVE